MLVFPQLSTGACLQYPIVKRRLQRTIVNQSEDGRIVALTDTYARRIQWDLVFKELTDPECLQLTSFYQSCEGPLQTFLFIDATENLLAFSEDLTQPAWVSSSLLTVSTDVTDPLGTTRASRLTNGSAGNIMLTQTVAIPGSVECAFSCFVRTDIYPTPLGSFQMSRSDGSTTASKEIDPAASWARVSLSTAFASSISGSCDFSITIPAGTSLDVFGLQLDAQPIPGEYLVSVMETGLFPNSRFDSNSVQVTATGPGQSTMKMSVVSQSSL